MDEIEQRLRDTSESCIRNYEIWRKDQKNIETRENLQEAVHELRKVASRLEIEIAASERDQMSDRPLPIPPHRSSRRRGNEGMGDEGGMPEEAPSADDNRGNNGNQSNAGNAGQGGGRPHFNRSGGQNRGRRPHSQGGGGGGRSQGE